MCRAPLFYLKKHRECAFLHETEIKKAVKSAAKFKDQGLIYVICAPSCTYGVFTS